MATETITLDLDADLLAMARDLDADLAGYINGALRARLQLEGVAAAAEWAATDEGREVTAQVRAATQRAHRDHQADGDHR
jgi:hypothetical protein